MSAIPAAAPTVVRRDRAVDPGRRKARIGLAIMGILILVAIFAPLLAPHDPDAIESSRVLRGLSLAHPFGSDALGRDVLSRVIFSFRVSLSVAVGSVLLAFLVGVPLGLVAGYCGGWVDTVIMRPVDMLLALPALLLAIALIAIVGPGTSIALIAISVIYVPILARVIRSSTLVVTSQTFIEAARAAGWEPPEKLTRLEKNRGNAPESNS